MTQEVQKNPEILDDSLRVSRLSAKKMKSKKVIVVQGLGFVAAVMSLVCDNALTEEYAVIAVDLASENTYWKIQSITDGMFP